MNMITCRRVWDGSIIGAWNMQPGVEKRGQEEINHGAQAWGCPTGQGNGWAHQGQHREKATRGRARLQEPPCSRLGGQEAASKGGKGLEDSPQSQGACSRGCPLTAQRACWHPACPWPTAATSQSSLQACWKEFSGRNTLAAVPPGTHLSSLFLQMHSPIISLISGSCTFSKLAGLMP